MAQNPNELRLSALLTEGLVVMPKQAFDTLFKKSDNGTLSACASGTIIAGALALSGYDERRIVKVLEEASSESRVPHPDSVVDMLSHRMDAETGFALITEIQNAATAEAVDEPIPYQVRLLHYAIAYLNDIVRMSREDIGALLKTHGL